MGTMSIWHWLVLGIVVLLLFGKGRFSDMMGDVAKGVKSFKKGMAEDDDAPTTPTTNTTTAAAPPPPPHRIEGRPVPPPTIDVEPTRTNDRPY